MTHDNPRENVVLTGVVLSATGFMLVIGLSIYAYLTVQERENTCSVNRLADAMIGRAAQDCETGVPTGVWIAISAGILMLITGIVLLAFYPAKPESPDGTVQPQVSHEKTEERLNSLKNLLDKELVTEEEYRKRREAILDDLQKT